MKSYQLRCGYCGKFISYDKRKLVQQFTVNYDGYDVWWAHKKCHNKEVKLAKKHIKMLERLKNV